MTSVAGVFAGGDFVTGPATVAQATCAGRDGADLGVAPEPPFPQAAGLCSQPSGMPSPSSPVPSREIRTPDGPSPRREKRKCGKSRSA